MGQIVPFDKTLTQSETQQPVVFIKIASLAFNDETRRNSALPRSQNRPSESIIDQFTTRLQWTYLPCTQEIKKFSVVDRAALVLGRALVHRLVGDPLCRTQELAKSPTQFSFPIGRSPMGRHQSPIHGHRCRKASKGHGHLTCPRTLPNQKNSVSHSCCHLPFYLSDINHQRTERSRQTTGLGFLSLSIVSLLWLEFSLYCSELFDVD